MLIHEVAAKLNISKRTIRYYEQLGLVNANLNENNGYRQYDELQLKQLQQIIYYRSLNISLKDIQKLLEGSIDEIRKILQQHVEQLEVQQRTLTPIIKELKEMIKVLEEKEMANDFKDRKKQWIENNEKQYGEEIRQHHGEESVMALYGKLKDMTEEQYLAAEQLQQTMFERLKEAMVEESEELLLEIAELHKRWLSFYWPKYSKQAHVGLAQMYVADERFTSYYDETIGDGATQLLYDAIVLYSKQ